MEPRTGVTPVERPTEWTTALVMLITAGLAWNTNHDTAAVVAVAAACLPVLVTTITSYLDRRAARNAPPAAPPAE